MKTGSPVNEHEADIFPLRVCLVSNSFINKLINIVFIRTRVSVNNPFLT